jgi:hypothetical protein
MERDTDILRGLENPTATLVHCWFGPGKEFKENGLRATLIGDEYL